MTHNLYSFQKVLSPCNMQIKNPSYNKQYMFVNHFLKYRNMIFE
jgi:hypothetical protein